MEEITIRYWSPHGRQEETKFQSSHSRIDLVMRAAIKVDLTNLQKCSRLCTLDLSNNMLKEIDLKPISNCSTLQEVRLRNNHLTNLDLWPLIWCVSLSEVDVSDNRLHGLDLSPIFLRVRVRMDSSVVIRADQILRYIFTNEEMALRFQLLRPDGAPWVAIPVVIWVDYETLSRDCDWGEIRERVTSLLKFIPEKQWFGCQRGLMQGLRMDELSGYDGNPSRLLDVTDSGMSYGEARHAIYDRMLDLLELQLDNMGPTLFLDIEKMKNTRASKLIPRIVEQRRIELDNTTLQVKGSKVFLRPLWFTHYGHKILKATGMGLISDLEGLAVLKNSFNELDLTLRTKEVQVAHQSYNGPASSGMQRHVLNDLQGLYH